MEIPPAEREMKQVQVLAHSVIDTAENNGPMIFTRIGMMRAINRHRPKEFDPPRKSTHWGKRKLKRDE
jgi:hypothetical protein